MVCCRNRMEIFIVFLFSLEASGCLSEPLTYELSSLGDSEFKEPTYYEQEARLRNDIFVNYSHLLRPFQSMKIYVTLVILRINELDIHLESFQFSGWLKVRWIDPRLTWDPQNYGNISDIYDSELVLWRPVIVVDNSVKRIGALGDAKLYLRVNHHGNVTWQPPNIFQTHCDVNPTYFPFDTQICHMDIAVWGLTEEQVQLYPWRKEINLDDFKENGEWIVVSSWITRSSLLDGDELQSELYFFIKLRRRPVHYVLTILIPVVVTCMMASLAFLVPNGSGAKIQFSLTILLTYTVTLSIVTGYLPSSSSHVSVLSVFMTCILVFGVTITFLVVTIVNWHDRPPDSPIPCWVRSVVGSCMLPLLSCKRPHCFGKKQTPPPTNISASNNADPASEGNENSQANPVQLESFRSSGTNSAQRTSSARLSLKLEKYLSDVVMEQYLEPIVGEAGEANRELTWQDCSEVLNQFCLKFLTPFVITLTFIGVVTLLIGGNVSAADEFHG